MATTTLLGATLLGADSDLVSVRVRSGAAGQIVATAVTHSSGVVTFVGSAYGSAVVIMVTEAWGQMRVQDSGRFGETFGAEWVRRFYA